MTLTLTQSMTAIGPGRTSSFLGIGGRKPYVYSVLAGGAGGTINARTGVYTAPSTAQESPTKQFDTIRVTDALAATATGVILIGSSLILFCDIIQTQLGLTADRVWVWDQKIFQPVDSALYIAVSIPMCKAFGNNTEFITTNAGVYSQSQSVNMQATIDVDIISRGPAARDRKEEVLLALNSLYSEQQQEANSFYIGKISTNFLNLSNIDGAAIPYRFKITCQMLYAVSKTTPIPYYSKFSGYTVTTTN